jgi:hypothetical protein
MHANPTHSPSRNQAAVDLLNKAMLLTGLCWCVLVRAADELPVAASVPGTGSVPAAVPAPAVEVAQTAPPPRPRAVPVGSAQAQAADESAARAADEASARKAPEGVPAKFTASDRWIIAGYNNNEIVYTIIVANDDTRILHCTALMQGWYLDHGKRLPISDRQSATVFPNQPAELGNWMDMDQPSGATYSVKCRPI